MAELLNKIGDIEVRHKRTLSEDTYTELLGLRRQLQALLLKKHYRQRLKAFYYIHTNKGGKLLARMLRGQQTHAQVHKLKIAGRRTTIAHEFRSYYTQLYNLHQQPPNRH
ncbi:Hypothetical predicted protein [Pelobates cultripes]|uniref:Uncharacterized protein n=1 Tax=Pelobates cultripes TaxID=61616 RepID=A0AAD1WSY8_PELCU|nr:Hypothetical predicted protein [Pelobates cultripes]